MMHAYVRFVNNQEMSNNGWFFFPCRSFLSVFYGKILGSIHAVNDDKFMLFISGF